ncbi:MAG: cupin domain-containing protein [Victivallaceae bacterium]|nr:cupin domain-containing protein [Victivallaceae bacterium]
MKTTDYFKNKPYEYHETPCHGGSGPWYFKDMIAGMAAPESGSLVRFIHDDRLPPGSAFGTHRHDEVEGTVFEEWYICLEGSGTMILDGGEVAFSAGDVNVCRGGGEHGVVNTGNVEMRIIVVCAKASAPAVTC